MKNKIYKYYFFFLTFLGPLLFAQNPDSLKQVLKNATQDTVRVKLLVELSDVCEIEEVDSYVNQALAICIQKLKNKSITSRERYLIFKYTGAALNNKGFINDQIGNSDKAIVYYELAIKMQEFINDQKGMAYSLNNIAFIYDNKGDVPKSLEYMHKALKIQEEIQDKLGVAISFINIGNVLRAHGEESKSIDYFNKGLKMTEELKNNSHMAVALLNIGDVYYTKGDTANALKHFNKAIALYEKEGDEYGLAYALVNRGHIFKKQHQYDKALVIFERSLNMLEKQGDKAGVAKTLVNMVEVLLKQNNVNKASELAQKGLKISQELGYPIEMMASSELLSRIYATNKNYEKAYEMHVLYKQMADSVNRQENRKASIQKAFQYEYEKKAAADSVMVADERKLFELKMQKEKTQRFALYAGLALIIGFLIFVINRFQVSQKQNKVIESQKLLVDEAYEKLNEKNKEVMDSIYYARKIQRALITSEGYIEKQLNRLTKEKNEKT